MSGSTRAITLNLSVAGADKLQQDLRNLGTAGEDALRRLEAAVTRSSSSGAGLPRLSAQTVEVSNGFRDMTPRIQSAGYQLQDFAVQVQGGTSAMTALSQQGSQFLGAFGPGGAIAGAILTVGVLVMKLLEGAANVAEINKANEAWKRNQSDINDLLESGIEKVVRLRRERLQSAEGPQRTALQTAEVDYEKAAKEVPILERQIATLQRLLANPASSGNQTARNTLTSLEARLAGHQATMRDAPNRATEASTRLTGLRMEDYGPPSSAATFDTNAGPRAVLESEATRRNMERLRGMSAPRAAIERARQAGEAEANRTTNVPAEREKIIANHVAAAIAQQETATRSLAETEAKRFAAALKPGEMEAARSAEQLRLAQALAAAETPREALLARQAAEIDKATLSIRTNAALQTDPKAKAALLEQAELIARQRTEAVGLEETTRNRNALYQQGAAFAQQAADRTALGMAPDERARFLGQFGEEQRIKSAGDRVDTPEAMQRIRNAGDLAYGDEQMRKLKDFTGALNTMGSSFTDALGAAVFEGKKLGDVLTGLERQLASTILKATVGKYLEQAVGAGSARLGSAIGDWWSGASAAGSTSPAAISSYNAGYMPGVVTQTPLANGGIMTGLGPLPLRQYAGGGVAHSPQVAIFGEAKKAEAYVPLPDGRSIPVTMSGGGGPSINIDARGAEQGVEQRIDAVLARRMPAILAASRADLSGRVNRGGDLAKTFGRR